jgi:hypothetical protein
MPNRDPKFYWDSTPRGGFQNKNKDSMLKMYVSMM